MRYIPLLAALLLSACAAPPDAPAFAVPTCESERECDAKWNAAQMWIKHDVGRPIVEQSDTLLQTNMSQSPGNYLSVRVEKAHVEDDTWRIEAEIYCAKRVGCDPSPWEATRDFNRYVNKAWKVIRKP